MAQLMGQLYYNPITEESTTNVCGFGNHDMCLNQDGDCQCSYPQHLVEHSANTVEPEPPDETQTSYS